MKKLMRLLSLRNRPEDRLWTYVVLILGKPLAYLLFQKLEIQNKFPNECLTMPTSNDRVFAER